MFATGAGSEREVARLDDLASLVKDDRLQILPQCQPISRLLALVQGCDLHVGLDSGVLHLAMSAGKPTVSLFRESAGRLGWAPRGEPHRMIVQECPCHQTAATSCAGGRSLCLSKITADEVARSDYEHPPKTRTALDDDPAKLLLATIPISGALFGGISDPLLP